ncbi:MAG: hypothetical protein COA36_01155 [Desulfotalea sp.]|nr:MAG: hypothetical protein COA36_01155 [Desulfotalea sp.]
MSTFIDRLKPAARTKTILLLSAGLWTLIGCMLISKGLYRLSPLPEYKLLIIVSAAVAAIFKSKFILDRAAVKGINRIRTFKDGTCLGAVYSVKTWLMVLCMIGMGVILRSSSLPMTLLSFIYLTIGLALVASSRHGWKAWFNCI